MGASLLEEKHSGLSAAGANVLRWGAFWHVQEQQGDQCGCNRLTEETVVGVEFSGEAPGQAGLVGHWKDLVLP